MWALEGILLRGFSDGVMLLFPFATPFPFDPENFCCALIIFDLASSWGEYLFGIPWAVMRPLAKEAHVGIGEASGGREGSGLGDTREGALGYRDSIPISEPRFLCYEYIVK